jgi:tRNA(Leu) C34 or U34 (ribose-2'-O)-methylase TrmL
MKGYRDVRMAVDDRVFDHFPPRKATPVAVELLPTAEPLVSFEHPDDALYVFGPEDGSLPKAVRLRCHRFVFIPTHHCLNLAAAVNVVLYDRRLKRHLAGVEPLGACRDVLHEARGAVAGLD